jgi:DNA-binding transcriptional LysR family regulator
VRLARDALARVRLIETRMADFSTVDAGQLRVSAFPSANAYLLPEAMRRFAAAHPAVTLILQQADPAGPLPAVRAGRVDLALVTAWELYADGPAAKHATADLAALPRLPLDGVQLVPLLDEELRVALPAGHRLSRQRRVRLADLREETWIEGGHPDCLGPIPPLAGALGGAPRIGVTCDDWTGKQALVAAGAGVTLVPTLARAAMRAGVAIRRTTPALPARRLYAVTARPELRPPAASAMLTLLAALAGQHLAGQHVGDQGLAGQQRAVR